MTRKSYSTIGAAVALAGFLAIGLLPALVYGGYAGVMLAGGLFGAPISATIAVRALVVLGMVLGAVGAGSLFAVAGAAAGAAASVLTGTPVTIRAKA